MDDISIIKEGANVSVRNEEIILNGPPSDLRGSIKLVNEESIPVKVRSFAMRHGEGIKENESALRVSCRLQAGEEKINSISHSISSSTPPGTYSSKMLVQGKEKIVKLVVQPSVNIEIYPSQFTFQDTSPGKKHLASFTLSNVGNMPFQIPGIKHVAPLDMDMLCGAFGFAFRQHGDKGFNKVMDEVTHNIYSNFIDWASTKVKEQGQVMEPGGIMLVNLEINMPKNADASKDYEGNIRFWDKEIRFEIKSHVV